jgi:hypothetical protein
MIGLDDRERVLYIALLPTAIGGLWRPITGWESRFARRLYNSTLGGTDEKL